MPTLSEFFGLTIRMYYNDHNPPHVHVYYGEFEAILKISLFEVLAGSLPRRAMLLAVEWVLINQEALRVNWRLAEQHLPLNPIPPLE